MKSNLPKGLFAWWLGLCAVSVVNIGLLSKFWVGHLRKKSHQRQEAYHLQRRLLWLSTFFVVGCAFRSFLPRADVKRITLVDHWLSSILVGRTVATIAELCFVGQWAILLQTFARPVKLNWIVRFSKLIFPSIVVAEVFSWRGVLTTNNFWHFLEESIWGSCEIDLTLSALSLRKRYHESARRFMDWMAACGAIYVTYMFSLDIPTYYSRWRLDQASGKSYTGFREGLRNLAYQWNTTHRPQDWEREFVWMAIYFSLAVWVSLAFTQAPIDRLDEGFVSSTNRLAHEG